MSFGKLGAMGRGMGHLGALGRTVSPLSLLSSIVGLGDSNTAGGSGLASSYFNQLTARGRGQFKFIYNAGVAGERSDQFLARVDADVIAKSPKVCVIQGPANDFLQAIDDATIRENYRQINSKLRNAGIAAIFVSAYPLDSANTRPPAHNAWLSAWCPQVGARYFDAFSLLTDGSNNFNATYGAGDGTHTNAAGGALVADAFNAEFANTWSAWPIASSNTASSLNLISNALALPDSNADGFPDGWAGVGSVGATFAASMVDDGTRGRGMKATLTGATACGFEVNLSSGFSVGDQLLSMFDARISSGLSVSMGVRFIGPSTNSLIYSPWAAATDSGIFAGTHTVPATTTAVRYRFFATGTGTLEVFKPTLRNLTLSPYDYA
jgi:lysophospholipase L1-like esterase